MKISVYPCLDKSSVPNLEETIEELVCQIKSPDKKTLAIIQKMREHGKHFGFEKPTLSGGNMTFKTNCPIKVYKYTNKSNKVLVGDFLDGNGSIQYDNNHYYDVFFGEDYLQKNTLKVDKKWDRKTKTNEDNLRNLYEHIKSTKLKCVSWNCLIKDYRRKDNIESVSGFIYGDVDNFLSTIEFFKNSDTPNKCATLEKAKEYVWSVLTNKGIPYISHAWRSIGGGGFGFLVACSGLTVENFTSTWLDLQRILASKGVFLDPATKDITRGNVLTYDPNIFVRDKNTIRFFQAVEPSYENTISKEGVISNENANPVLSKILAKVLNNKENHNSQENRLSYSFYQKYYSLTCDVGIDFNTAHSYLIAQSLDNPLIFGYRNEQDAKSIGEHQYQHWTFGKRAILKNIDYNGNKSLKIQWLLYKNTKGGKPSSDELDRVIRVSKFIGILQSDLIDNLKSEKWYNEDVFSSIEKIYSDEKYAFGRDAGYSDEKFNTLRQQYIGRLKSNGYDIVELESFDGKLDITLDEILTSSRNIFGELSDKNKFKFCTYFFEQSMSYAIDMEDSLEYLLSMERDFSKEFITFIGNEVYNDYCWKFGIKKVKRLSKESILSQHNIKQTHYLPNDKHISDLNLDVPDYSIIWGNTGQGKTTWICGKMFERRIVLLPIKSAVRSIQLEYGASVYYEDEKNVKDGDNLIACTYSSFPKLFQIMQNWEHSVDDYELYFDESHNYAVSASPEYRGYELNFIAENMRHFKKRALFTGTLIKVLHPIFDRFQVVRVNWENVPVKPFWRVKYTDIRWSICTLLDRKRKNIIYLQNKKMDKDLGMLIEALKGRGFESENIACINADEKSSDCFQKIINEQLIDDKVKVIICTSVIVEALSINNNDIGTIHFYTHESPHLMEQMVNRFRKIFTTHNAKSDCKIYVYEKLNAATNKSLMDDLDIVDLQKNYIEDAKMRLRYMSKPYTSGDSLSMKISSRKFMQDVFGKSALFRVDETKKWAVDYLSIANMAFLDEKRHCYGNIEYMKLLLSEYNWEFMGDIIHESTLSNSEILAIKNFKEEQKELLAQVGNNILCEIKSEGEDLCIENISDDKVKQYDGKPNKDLQIDLRSKVKWLCNYVDFADAIGLVGDWINVSSFSERIFKKVVRQINVKALEQVGNVMKHQDLTQEFSKQMIDFYFFAKKQQDERGYYKLPYLKTVIKDKMRSCAVMSFDEIENISDELTLDVFNLFYEVSGVPDDKGNVYYKIGGLHFHNDVFTFNRLFVKWLKKCCGSDKTFTSSGLADIINDMRSNLPILSTYKINPANALKLIADYAVVKQKSKVIVDGKRQNVYAVESTVPQELGGIRVNTFRKLDIRDIHFDDLTETQKEYLFKTYQPKELIYFLEVKESSKEKAYS